MSNRFDELLDKVLRQESAVEPRAGLEQRVMARVDEDPAPASRRWMFAAWAGGLGMAAAAAVALVVLLPGRHELRTVRHGDLVSGASVALSTQGELPSGAKAPAGPVIYGTAEAVPLSKTGLSANGGAWGVKAGPVAVSRGAEVGRVRVKREEARLPKLETFPAPAPVDVFPRPVAASDGGRELAALRSEKEVGAALAALRQEQNEPIRIAAIEIAPLQ